jgi:hypothetical protein
MHVSVEELLYYTGEERQTWETWFRLNGEDLLKMPIAGGNEKTVGALILSIFGPEMRYAQLLRGEVLVEYRARPCEHVAELFGFGLETRKLMRAVIRSAAPEDWTRVYEFSTGGESYSVSMRKIVFHALVREIRNWAQVSRIMRDHGFEPPANRDLLSSSALL